MVGDFSMGWSQASAFGMLIGKVDAQAHLEDGLLKFRPIQTTIGDRRLGHIRQFECHAIAAAQLRFG